MSGLGCGANDYDNIAVEVDNAEEEQNYFEVKHRLGDWRWRIYLRRRLSMPTTYQIMK